MTQYIKMSRGTQAAYDKAKQAGSLDDNTLYFIYEDKSASTGTLYLGTRLISGGEKEVTIANSLGELSDVGITSAAEGDFIVYNGSGEWVNATKDTIAETLTNIMKENGDLPEHIPQVWTGTMTEPDAGDVDAAITRIIGEGTAYIGDVVILDNSVLIYDGSSWSKDTYYTTGERVKFTNNITVDEKNTIEAQGKTLDEVLKQVAQMGGQKADGKSIEETEKVLSLFNFGKNYYKNSEEGQPTLTPGFQAGLIPVVRAVEGDSFELGWYVPSEIETIAQLLKSVETINTTLENTYNKTEVDQKIAEAKELAPDLTYEKVASREEIPKDTEEATKHVYLVPNEQGDGYEQWVVPKQGDEPIMVGGFTADLDEYVTKTEAAETERKLDTAIKAVDTKVDNLTNSLDNYVEKTIYTAEVGDLKTLLGYDEDPSITVVKKLNEIDERLTWEDLTE